MDDDVEVPWPGGRLILRPERPEDQIFRFQLFCDSRGPEWSRVALPRPVFNQIMDHQFDAQTRTYAQRFPAARFDIAELDGRRIGRIVVNRPGDHVHIIDQAVIPERRGQGLGTAMMRFLMDEATVLNQPVRLKLASDNDPSWKLYDRLGFRQVAEHNAYIEMEWRPGTGS